MSTGPTLTGKITLVDETGGALASIQGNVDKTFKGIADSADEAQKKVSTSTTDLVKSFSGVATSALALGMSIERVSDSQVTLDRANLMVHSTSLQLEKAQTAYNDAVAKYGVESDKAALAANALSLAQERYQVTIERADMSQRHFQDSILSTAVTAIPTSITMFTSLSSLLGGSFTSAISGAGLSVSGLSAGLGALAAGAAAAVAVVGLSAVSLANWISEGTEAQKKEVELDAANVQLRNSFMDMATSMGGEAGVITGLSAVAAKAEEVTSAQTILTDATAIAAGGEMGITDEITKHGAALVDLSSTSYAATTSQTALTNATYNAAEAAKKAAEAEAARADAMRASAKATYEQSAANAQANALALQMQQDLAETNAMISASMAVTFTVAGQKYAYFNTLTPLALTYLKQTYPGIQDYTAYMAAHPELTGEESYSAAGAQAGFNGMVTKPTLLLVGEAGPEQVNVIPMASGGGTAGGINIQGPLIVVQGSLDRITADYVLGEAEKMLKNVWVEASSASAPATSKRIRFGAKRGGI